MMSKTEWQTDPDKTVVSGSTLFADVYVKVCRVERVTSKYNLVRSPGASCSELYVYYFKLKIETRSLRSLDKIIF